MTTMRRFIFCVLCLAATPALGQIRATQEEFDELQAQQQQQARRAEVEAAPLGRTAESAAGRAGQRQTREQAAPNAQPMTRISSRINNRVQSRIRNRIDRNYNPQANATSPFAVAEEETRTRSRRGR